MAATGFGGGLGRCQLVCGALTGGVIACSLAVARKRGSDRADRNGLRGETYALVRELVQAFEDRFGAVDCRTITGHDFAAPGGHQAFSDSGARDTVCRPAVRLVVEAATKLCEQAAG